jgi:citrate lyase subunit beta/citryl-CoA lyase
MRSKLFVPGSRPELFAKAAAGDADALSFDLEDAVAEGRKADARAYVAAFLRDGVARDAGKTLIVRCNAPGSAHFDADLAAIVPLRPDLLNVPKIDGVDALRATVDAITRIEREHAPAAPLRLLVNIETPKALRHAAEIAGADARVAGLQLGLADLFEPFGIDRRDPANVHAAMFQLRMAAAEAVVYALDAAYADVADEAGFEAEAARARGLGFAGKSCIHPRQVALANRAFAPSADAVAAARRLLDAATGLRDRGAFLFEGRMVDAPFLARAQAIVDAADGGGR